MEKIDSKKLVPKAGAAYGHGWRTLWKYFITLLLVSLILVVATIPFAIPANLSDLSSSHYSFLAIAVVFGQIFAIAYSLFVISPLEYGIKWIYLKSVRDQKPEVSEAFEPFKNYLNVVLASLLSGAIIAFGFFLVIIPGIIFACRLAFVPYLVMDKKLDPVKAVEESWRLTKGHGWRIFWMAIIAFFVIILGLLCLGFGVFISFMWIRSAFASIYHAVLEEKGELVEVPAEQ